MRRLLRSAIALLLLGGMVLLWAWGDRWLVPEEISGTRVHARDGDTLTIGDVAIRIAGIDAPEYHQSCTGANGRQWLCGQAARTRLAELIAPGEVRCAVEATDKYHRRVARCAARGTADVGEAMVRAGLAISPAMRGQARYADAEDSARAAKRGIWAGSFATPADWRASHLLTPSPTPPDMGE
jgi:endonuclease YncB( thermonuclease family)